MEKDYSITYLGDVVGTAHVTQSGLYYRFCCYCKLPPKKVFKLWARCGQKQEKLGICMPHKEGYALSARIPVKHLGDGDITVFADTAQAAENEPSLPVSEDAPFEMLDMLDDAFLSESGERILFKCQSAAPQDSDRIP